VAETDRTQLDFDVALVGNGGIGRIEWPVGKSAVWPSQKNQQNYEALMR
jgi:hypothetical protein